MQTYIRSLCVLFFILTSHVIHAMPAGSYLSTCYRCNQFFNSLSCSCLNRQQIPVWSTLNNVSRCNFVSNEDGHLVCHQLGNPLPPGSYQSTCHFCHIDPIGNLQCQCLNRNQFVIRSSLYNGVNCPWVVNDNGHLICSQQSYGPQTYLPNGNYGSTCQSCRMRGNALFCSCQKANGAWGPTSLFNAAQCGFVENYNGQLICTMGGQNQMGHHR